MIQEEEKSDRGGKDDIHVGEKLYTCRRRKKVERKKKAIEEEET